jgi:hypothetical protein
VKFTSGIDKKLDVHPLGITFRDGKAEMADKVACPETIYQALFADLLGHKPRAPAKSRRP